MRTFLIQSFQLINSLLDLSLAPWASELEPFIAKHFVSPPSSSTPYALELGRSFVPSCVAFPYEAATDGTTSNCFFAVHISPFVIPSPITIFGQRKSESVQLVRYRRKIDNRTRLFMHGVVELVEERFVFFLPAFRGKP
jgi:hypothetical protein